MDWSRNLFNLPPVFISLLALGVGVTALIILAPRSGNKTDKTASKYGFNKISLLQLAQYLNRTSCTCLKTMFDGSRFNSSSIGEIYSGKYENFLVTIFTLVLPTGRVGTHQTVIHLRHDPIVWLPMFSIIDEVAGKSMSKLMQCEHTHNNPLMNPNYINRHSEADKLREILPGKSVNELSISALKSPLYGIVLDSTGEDLYFYQHGKIVEPDEWKGFIEHSIKIWQMIDAGYIDLEEQ